MEITHIFLDTNAYTAFKYNNTEAIRILTYAEQIGMNSVVIGELQAGFAMGVRADQNFQELQEFLSSYRVRKLSIDYETATYYAQVYQNLKKKGRPIPTNDMWIAATALQHNFAVFSYDKHFEAIDGLMTGKRLDNFLNGDIGDEHHGRHHN